MNETGESSQTCPKCSGLSVKSIESWNISKHREVTEPPMPMCALYGTDLSAPMAEGIFRLVHSWLEGGNHSPDGACEAALKAGLGCPQCNAILNVFGVKKCRNRAPATNRFLRTDPPLGSLKYLQVPNRFLPTRTS